MLEFCEAFEFWLDASKQKKLTNPIMSNKKTKIGHSLVSCIYENAENWVFSLEFSVVCVLWGIFIFCCQFWGVVLANPYANATNELKKFLWLGPTEKFLGFFILHTKARKKFLENESFTSLSATIIAGNGSAKCCCCYFAQPTVPAKPHLCNKKLH